MDPVIFIEKIDKFILEAINKYYKLILIVYSITLNKEDYLNVISKKTGVNIINANYELSKKLINYSKNEHPFKVSSEFEEMIKGSSKRYYGQYILILDNIDILFDHSLKIDPFRLLKQFSRNKIIIAFWPGKYEDEILEYAEIGYEDYRKYSGSKISDICILKI